MAKVTFKRGPSAALNTVPIVDGQITVTIDTGEMYVDVPDDGGQIVRKKITDTSLENLHFEVVEELPEVGEGNVIYLVPKSIIGVENTYDEYIYSNGQWELIGDTEIDLSDYAKKNGYYPDLFAGGADQLISTTVKTDAIPYSFRPSGGSLSVNDNVKLSKIVGGDVIWNQLAKPYAANNYQQIDCTATFGTDNSATMTASAMYGRIQAECNIPISHIALVLTEMKTATLTTSIQLRISTEGSVGSAGFSCASTTDWQNVGAITKPVYNITHISIQDNRSSDRDAIQLRNIQVFDLTQMFGNTIAEYIQSLGFENGLAWFRALFPKPSYQFSDYVSKSVQTAGHKTVGFNIYDNNNPQVLGGYEYQITGDYTSLGFQPTLTSAIETITPDATGHFTPRVNGYLNITGAQSNVCVHLTWDGERDNEFETYQGYVHNLDSDIVLNGVPVLDSNNKLNYIGDEYTPDGRIKRKFTVIDLSTLSWQYVSSSIYWYATNIPVLADSAANGVFLSEKYMPLSQSNYTNMSYSAFKRICYVSSFGGQFWVYDGSSTTPPSGKIIVELATPTWDTAEPYQEIQTVSNWGTEQFIPATTADVFVPVGHVSEYTIDLKAKLESSPDSPNNDGTYILKRESGANAYVAFNPFEYAKINGYYQEMQVGKADIADQLESKNSTSNNNIYNRRPVGGTTDVGNRKYEEIVGVDIVWNQLCNPADYEVDKTVDNVSFAKQSDGSVLISIAQDESEPVNLYTADNCVLNERIKTDYTQTEKNGTYITDFMPADCSNGMVLIRCTNMKPWVGDSSLYTQQYPFIERIAYYTTNDNSGYIYDSNLDLYGTSYVHGNSDVGASSISGTTKFEIVDNDIIVYLGSRYNANNPSATMSYTDSIRYFKLEINMGSTALTENDILSTDELEITAKRIAGYKLSAPDIFVPGHKYLLALNSKEMYDAHSNIMPCITNSTFTAFGCGDPEKTNYIFWKADSTAGNLFAIEVLPFASIGDYEVFPQISDLSLMFGTEIANFWYSHQESAGIPSFLKYFPKTYYSYNPGELMAVNLSAVETIGFNLYNHDTGTAELLNRADVYRSQVEEDEDQCKYQITGDYTSLSFTDIDGNIYDFTYTPDNEGYFEAPMRRGTLTVVGGNEKNTCVHLTWSGYRDYTFEPYVKNTYVLDNSLTLHGIPTLEYYNKILANGDIYESDGTVTRKYATLNLGNIIWSKQTIPNTNIVIFIAPPPTPTPASQAQLLCTKYVRASAGGYSADIADQTIYMNSGNGIGIRDDSKASLSATEFKTAMSNVYVVYERQGVPITETATPYTNPMAVDDFGIGRFVDYAYEQGLREIEVPAGNNAKYRSNLRDKLENLPDQDDYNDDMDEVWNSIDEIGNSLTDLYEETLPNIVYNITELQEHVDPRCYELETPLRNNVSYDLGVLYSDDLNLVLPWPENGLDEIYVAFRDANSLTISADGYNLSDYAVGDFDIVNDYVPGNVCELSFKYVAGVWILVAKQYEYTQPE